MALTLIALYGCVAVIAGATLNTAVHQARTACSPPPMTQRVLIGLGAALWPLLLLGLAQLVAIRVAADGIGMIPRDRAHDHTDFYSDIRL